MRLYHYIIIIPLHSPSRKCPYSGGDLHVEMYTAILFKSQRGFINLQFPVDSFAITAQKFLRAKNTVLGGTAKKGGLGS